MQISNDDLANFVDVIKRMDTHRDSGTLILPSNMVISDSQKSWLKNNGIERIEQSGDVIIL